MMAHAGRLALEVLKQQSLQLFRRAGGGAGELEGYSRREERKEETSASAATPRTAPTRGARVRDSAESFHLGVGLLRASTPKIPGVCKPLSVDGKQEGTEKFFVGSVD